MVKKRPTTSRVPTRPSSSPSTAKMKSVWASGRSPHFWVRGADALAEPAAGRERVEAVGGLPAGVVVVLERVGEGGDPRDAARCRSRPGTAATAPTTDDADDEEPRRRADHPEHAEQDREEHQRGAEVAADDDEPGRQQHAGHHRDHHVVHAAEAALLAGVDVGGPQDQAELGDLGRLDGERADGQPVLVAVALHAEERGSSSSVSDDDVAGPGQPADPARCGSREATKAHGRPMTTHISWRFTTA